MPSPYQNMKRSRFSEEQFIGILENKEPGLLSPTCAAGCGQPP
jgi:hypothetical protein